jgi:excisionase family DNA binding protein
MPRVGSVPKRSSGRPRKEPLERPPDPTYLTIEEFCVLVHVSKRTWKRHKPYLRTIRLGNRTLIARTEVERYLDSLSQPAQIKQPEYGMSKGRV